MVSSYPRFDPDGIDADAEETMALIIDVVNSIRTLRWEMNIAPSQLLEVVLCTDSARSLDMLNRYSGYIESLGKASRITTAGRAHKPEAAVTALVRDVEVFLPLKGVIDFAEEQRRLQKELAKLHKDLADVTRKLSNREFLAKAPEAVIEKEQARSRELTDMREKLQSSLERIEGFMREGTS